MPGKSAETLVVVLNAALLVSYIPLKVKRFLRVARAFWCMTPARRDLVLSIVESGLGLHGKPFRFVGDGLCTIHNCDFLSDERFAQAYALGVATGSWNGWDLPWRAYMTCYFGSMAAKLGGDFVECGVNRGGNARMLIEYVGLNSMPPFYLMDTFSGFDGSSLNEEERRLLEGRYEYHECLENVRETFREFPFVKVVPGSVLETVGTLPCQRVAFVSIDMNCVAPEIAAATFLWPLLQVGGVMILDDYGFADHGLQKSAFDQFAKERGTSVLALPTGQGVLLKT